VCVEHCSQLEPLIRSNTVVLALLSTFNALPSFLVLCFSLCELVAGMQTGTSQPSDEERVLQRQVFLERRVSLVKE
jgi:hypothetical protein